MITHLSVDPEDAHVLDWFAWHVSTKGYLEATAWCRATKTKHTVKFHRIIMPVKDGQQIDHINGDKLDNRKSNLRITDDSGNSINRDYVRNAQCIRWNQGSYEVRVRRKGVTHYARCATFEEAVEVRDALRAKY